MKPAPSTLGIAANHSSPWYQEHEAGQAATSSGVQPNESASHEITTLAQRFVGNLQAEALQLHEKRVFKSIKHYCNHYFTAENCTAEQKAQHIDNYKKLYLSRYSNHVNFANFEIVLSLGEQERTNINAPSALDCFCKINKVFADNKESFQLDVMGRIAEKCLRLIVDQYKASNLTGNEPLADIENFVAAIPEIAQNNFGPIRPESWRQVINSPVTGKPVFSWIQSNQPMIQNIQDNILLVGRLLPAQSPTATPPELVPPTPVAGLVQNPLMFSGSGVAAPATAELGYKMQTHLHELVRKLADGLVQAYLAAYYSTLRETLQEAMRAKVTTVLMNNKGFGGIGVEESLTLLTQKGLLTNEEEIVVRSCESALNEKIAESIKPSTIALSLASEALGKITQAAQDVLGQLPQAWQPNDARLRNRMIAAVEQMLQAAKQPYGVLHAHDWLQQIESENRMRVSPNKQLLALRILDNLHCMPVVSSSLPAEERKIVCTSVDRSDSSVKLMLVRVNSLFYVQRSRRIALSAESPHNGEGSVTYDAPQFPDLETFAIAEISPDRLGLEALLEAFSSSSPEQAQQYVQRFRPALEQYFGRQFDLPLIEKLTSDHRTVAEKLIEQFEYAQANNGFPVLSDLNILGINAYTIPPEWLHRGTAATLSLNAPTD